MLSGLILDAAALAMNQGRAFAAFIALGLCVLPPVAGAALSGDPWTLVLLAQAPFFLFGASAAIARGQRMARWRP